MNHYSPAQGDAEDGLLIFLEGPLNCIGYWTISIFSIIFVVCEFRIDDKTQNVGMRVRISRSVVDFLVLICGVIYY